MEDVILVALILNLISALDFGLPQAPWDGRSNAANNSVSVRVEQ